MEANTTPAYDGIVLQGGSTYLINIPGRDEDNAATGDLDIRQPLGIGGTNGNKPTILVQNGVDRAFDIINVQNSDVSFVGLNIQGGDNGGDNVKPAGGIQVSNSGVFLMWVDVSTAAGAGVAARQASANASIVYSTISGVTNADVFATQSATVAIDSSSLIGSTQGLYITSNATVDVQNSTISGHSSNGISVSFGAQAHIAYSTIADVNDEAIRISGDTSALTVMGTVFAGNGASCWTSGNPTVNMTGNLYDDDSCPHGGVTDGSLFNMPVYLSLLGDHGGFTPTHRPMTNSPALDAITGPACSEDDHDQRLMPRAVAFKGDQPACDIGAVELETDVIFFDQVDRL